MYESYWQLESAPFRDAGDPAFYFAGESFEAGLLKIQYVVENGLGAGLIVGEPGVGKSHLVGMLEQRLPQGCGPVVRLHFPQLTPAEFLAHLAAELSVHVQREVSPIGDSTRAGTDVLLRRVHRLLDDLATDGRHPVIVVDEVHLLEDDRTLQTLHLLLNHHPRGHLEFSLVLLGLPVVLPRLERFPQLHDRLAVRSLLRRLDARETADYVRHRLQAAGCPTSPFDDEALQSLFACSRGLPRRLNRLADMAMLVGYADRLDAITADVVEGVAHELVAVRAA